MALGFMQKVNTPDGGGYFISSMGTEICLVAVKIPASKMTDEEIMDRKVILKTLDQRELAQALKDARATALFQINKKFMISQVSAAT